MEEWIAWLLILIVLFFAVILCLLIFYSVRSAQPDLTTTTSKHQGRVVIAGLLRNGERALPRIKDEVTRIGKSFEEYRILVVENDSDDRTREELLRWVTEDTQVTVLGCGINAGECRLRLPKTLNHEGDRSRIAKMAYLRNIYLNHIRTYLMDHDYLLVIDYDLRGVMDTMGFESAVQFLHSNPEADGVCCYGIVDHGFASSYFDTIAHRELGEEPDFPSQAAKVNYDIGLKLSTWGICNGTLSTEGIRRVGSCFGGMTLYRLSSLLDKGMQYAAPSSPERIGCEHAFLHSSLKVYLNQDWKFVIHENPLA